MTRKRIFTVGGTVQAGSGTYLTRPVDDELLQLCRAGEYAYVLTARQMGKSSLMVQTATALHEETAASVIIDLSQIGANVSAESWYVGLLTMIESRLALDVDAYEWWVEHGSLGPAQRLVQFFRDVVLSEYAQQVVVFIDEIDTTLSLDFTDDFFAALRAMHNARSVTPEFERLSFVLIGVAMPGDLISDPRRTPFNIGHGVDAGYFGEEEALPLIAGFELPPDRAREVLRWILDWTGGHPFLTQRLCAVVAERAGDGITKAVVDRAVEETFLGDQSEKDANLRFVQDMLVRRAPNPEAVLQTFRDIIRGKPVADDRQSLVVSHLKLSGVVRRTGRRLHVANRIYARVFDAVWLAEYLPKHWIRSVPPAVRGLVAASFVAIIAIGALFFARFEASQAQRQQALLEEQNMLLAASTDSTAAANQQLSEAQEQNTSLIDALQVTNANLDVALLEARRQQRLAEEARGDLQSAYAESELSRSQAEEARDDLANQNRVADSLRAVAENALDQTRDARRETLVLALSNAAERLSRRGEADLAALLARRAYLLGETGSGSFDDAVLAALRQSLNALEPGAGGPWVALLADGAARAVRLSPDGGSLFVGSEGGTLRRWALDPEGPVETHVLRGHEGGIRALAVGVGGFDAVTAGEDGKIVAWTFGEGGDGDRTEVGVVQGGAWALAVSGDGTRLAGAGADGVVRIWDLRRPGENPIESPATGTRVRALAFDAREDRVLVGGEDGVLRAWSVGSRMNDAADPDVGSILAAAFSPDGSRLAVAGTHQEIVLLDTDTWTEARALTGHEARVFDLAFDPTGHRLYSGSADGTVQIWDLVHTDRQTMVLEAHDDWVTALSASPDGSVLATGSADRTVSIWTLDLEHLAARVCTLAARTELTEEEWSRFMGVDFPYDERDPTCPGGNLARFQEDRP